LKPDALSLHIYIADGDFQNGFRIIIEYGNWVSKVVKLTLFPVIILRTID